MKRNGSALLIVLGVLAFLVVSAVAFSAFMRRARLPSSYLRRNVASRELAKAAVAEVIDIIDQSINSNVHPGIGNNVTGGCKRDSALGFLPRNTWSHRIYMPPAKSGDDIRTVPTLTLEGLAYIPPPLINEARYYSRLTPTAEWQSFGYDVGRYAFCAIDVSDYFDVNRLIAGYPRSSAANSRITIAHLFEEGENGNGGWDHPDPPENADKWDDFMDTFRTFTDDPITITYNEKVPLVSLADFNLALHANGGIGNVQSPFSKYVVDKEDTFYPMDNTKVIETYASMTFVTDGLFPNGNNTGETYDLADGRYQPFRMADLKGDKSPLLSAAALAYKQDMAPSDDAMIWYDRLSGFGMAALADYLDENHVPISLAVPTTERVPMICGVEPKLAQKPTFGVERTDDGLKDKDGNDLPPDDGQSVEREVSLVVRWNVKPGIFTEMFQGGEIRALVAYPFLHKGAADKSTWTLDGTFAMFFTSESSAPFRTNNSALGLTDKNLPETGIDTKTGADVITVKLNSASPQFNAITDEKTAIWESPDRALKLDEGRALDARLAMKGNELLMVTYQWTQTRQKNQDGVGFTEWKPSRESVLDDPKANGVTVSSAHTALRALISENGTVKVDPDFKDDNSLKDMIDKELKGDGAGKVKKVHLNAAVWLRIKDSDGNVVDMVPADVNCDRTQNSISDPGSISIGSHAIADAIGPLLKFDTGVEFDFGIAGMKSLENSGDPVSISPAAVMVPDPRHNHAPENWYSESAGITAERWLDTNLSDSDDGDIFMATSDAGYLQSIYELAFLPQLTDLRTCGNSKTCGNYGLAGVARKNWNNDKYAGKAEDTFNAEFMWRTYDPISTEEEGGNKEAFKNLPFTSEGTGLKVNPYSDSTNVLMAAFANTPVDWRCASTNVEFSFAKAIRRGDNGDVASFNEKYAWNSYNESAKFRWYDLEKIAGRFMDEICPPDKRNDDGGNSTYTPWETAWDNLDWYVDKNSPRRFLGETMDASSTLLWSVDRKFLYGYWRDCFAAKQQLFLIFVRAEPLLLGGGSADQLPPQLGARAVALVWRDPTTSSKAVNGYPHRTRLLFYRPLD